MTKTEYREYIQSPAWQVRRKDFLKSLSFCCKCWIPRYLAQLTYDQDLHVHHLSYANVGNEKPNDLMPLCRRCHEIETFGRSSLKEIKSHICGVCKTAPVFDPYSNNCEVCNGLIVDGYSRRSLVAPHWGTAGAVWEQLLAQIGATVGMDAVMRSLKAQERYITLSTKGIQGDGQD